MDAAVAVAVALLFCAYHAVRGFPSLADSRGDNDSLLRLVQVRDLLSGQPWFDLYQYRMGLEGGFVMHWSRLVDLPIALLVMIAGEPAALVIWPLMLLALCLFLIIRAARLLGGSAAVLPAAVTGALALHFVNVFVPGALDHHNLQLALVLGVVCALMAGLRGGGPSAAFAGVAAGVCAAFMLAVGMETAPYAAVACAIAAFCYLSGTKAPTQLAGGFGFAFAGTVLVSFLATVPAREWLSVQCDALSLPQTTLALLGGGGLGLAAYFSFVAKGVWARLAVLAAVAVVVALVAVGAFRQCLSDPYADLDPMLRQYWLSAVTEAQSLAALVHAGKLTTLAGYYVTPLIALLVMGRHLARNRTSYPVWVLFAFVMTALMVSAWQVRGGVFSVPLASIALAAWIGGLRERAEADSGVRPQLLMAFGWLVSIAMVWQLAAIGIEKVRGTGQQTSDAVEAASACYALEDYASLAEQPAGTVLSISNLGSSILHETHHRVLNGPYHRNNAGNRAALEILMADPDRAEAMARAAGIDYLAFCAGNDETRALAQWAPGGLISTLSEGVAPEWLKPLDSQNAETLQLFTVLPR